jgi:hypothetical protein
MQVAELSAGDRPHPQKERYRWLRGISWQGPGDLEVGVLENVRRIDPALEPPVHSQLHHAAQAAAVAVKELPQRCLVAQAGFIQEGPMTYIVSRHVVRACLGLKAAAQADGAAVHWRPLNHNCRCGIVLVCRASASEASGQVEMTIVLAERMLFASAARSGDRATQLL